VCGGNHQHGNNFFSDDGLANARDQVLDRNGAFTEEFFHQLVVAFGNHLYQLFVGFSRIVGQCRRNFLDFWSTVAIRRVHVRFHRDEIDDAAKTSFGAYGQLEGDHASAEGLLERFH
jgi:hypothetical protein